MQLPERAQPAVRLADCRTRPTLASTTLFRSAPGDIRRALSAADAQSRYAHASRLVQIPVLAVAFEWDHQKDLANQQKHGVAFKEESTVFGDPLAWFQHDMDYSHA
jgi:hypothetical protein